MACFIVPAAEAVVAKAVEAVEEKREEQESDLELTSKAAIPFSVKLKWLSHLLMGGVILLAFEHLWHGEVVPWFPFLTAMSDPAEMSAMFHEMATVGVSMAILITAVWAGICVAAEAIAKRPEKAAVHVESDDREERS